MSDLATLRSWAEDFARRLTKASVRPASLALLLREQRIKPPVIDGLRWIPSFDVVDGWDLRDSEGQKFLSISCDELGVWRALIFDPRKRPGKSG